MISSRILPRCRASLETLILSPVVASVAATRRLAIDYTSRAKVPLEGLCSLCTSMAACLSGTCDPALHHVERRATVDGGRSGRQPCLPVAALQTEHRRGVEQDHVAARAARFTAKNGPRDARIFLRTAAGQLLYRRWRQPQAGRVEFHTLHPSLAQGADPVWAA